MLLSIARALPISQNAVALDHGIGNDACSGKSCQACRARTIPETMSPCPSAFESAVYLTCPDSVTILDTFKTSALASLAASGEKRICPLCMTLLLKSSYAGVFEVAVKMNGLSLGDIF